MLIPLFSEALQSRFMTLYSFLEFSSPSFQSCQPLSSLPSLPDQSLTLLRIDCSLLGQSFQASICLGRLLHMLALIRLRLVQRLTGIVYSLLPGKRLLNLPAVRCLHFVLLQPLLELLLALLRLGQQLLLLVQLFAELPVLRTSLLTLGLEVLHLRLQLLALRLQHLRLLELVQAQQQHRLLAPELGSGRLCRLRRSASALRRQRRGLASLACGGRSRGGKLLRLLPGRKCRPDPLSSSSGRKPRLQLGDGAILLAQNRELRGTRAALEAELAHLRQLLAALLRVVKLAPARLGHRCSRLQRSLRLAKRSLRCVAKPLLLRDKLFARLIVILHFAAQFLSK
ncbi:hypothetical protein D3C77_368390 [compost metagenome]